MTLPTIVHQVQKPSGACKDPSVDWVFVWCYNIHIDSNKEHTMWSKEFDEIRIGSMFRFNGSDYRKQSTRTARNLNYDRVFYFGNKEVIHPIAW